MIPIRWRVIKVQPPYISEVLHTVAVDNIGKFTVIAKSVFGSHARMSAE